MNMFLHELKAMRKSTLIWICALIGMTALYMSIYPSMTADAESFRKLLAGYPPSVRAMLGIRLESITSMLGFYSFIFSFIVLGGAIQAMIMGVSILSKETRERTADFLLVKPVSRQSIVTAKLLAAGTVLFITNAVFYAAAAGMAGLAAKEAFDHWVFFLINLTLFFVQLIFLALGAAVSVFFNKLKGVLPISLGVVFGLYVVGALLAADDSGSAARVLSPFQYFSPAYVVEHAGYETPFLLLGAVVVAIGAALTYFIYIRKDIHAV
jgi:ABC-2 type transport system permease protein